MKTALLTTTLALLSSCVTPASRIKHYPEKYAALSDRDKALANEGRIQPGSSQDEVFFAWGEPDRVSKGNLKGKLYEDWVYMELQPVGVSPLGYGYDWGFDMDPFYDYYWDNEVDYVSVPAAVVRFEDGVVKGWRKRVN